ncbi:LytTR family DNA-binding domain-containing protein [Paucibacter sp. TC2R-5]|uniref:LytR/AlgR family response regulator transcription factor n=1 Tax=Paucibacter sp. TC2R-5 TaxID=2893555 RepID=UPI0021E3CC39|nr:LytTR family DNA-binding domain-containing protein [Paucibacter sp. TC2R-5]MCV2359936.1 LytTR family DNA-binding domain-containing protein [Paucibacter sp. TC2R-5]
MRVLIVDDEPQARARLQRLLSAMPGIEIAGIAKDGEQALAQVAALAPDVIFLDIQMPGISGLDVAASLPDPAPAVVFATAFDRYALEAFDSDAVDYLLKPVEAERLARALDRLRDRLRTRISPTRAEQAPPAQLLIPDRGRTHVVAVAEILWLEAADNYVLLHLLDGRTPLLRRSLAGLLVDLGAGFMRTHRSAAVATAQVLALGNSELALRGGASAPCSRQYRAAVLAQLSSNSKAL